MRDLPPPLPPGERTVGQLVAETIRLYGDNFWRALPTGVPLAIAYELILGHQIDVQIAVLCALAPLFSAAFVKASLVALDAREVPPRRIALAFAVGVLVWLPAPILLRAYILPSLAWLALFGLAVPVVVREGLGFRAALARARRLATAHYVHAFGSLCALVIVVALSAGVLSALLHGQGESTRRVASFLALLVLSPLLYLGGAMLYFDQAARVGSRRSQRRRRRDADLHPPLDPDAAGSADPQVEP
jgi:hypothetical protein